MSTAFDVEQAILDGRSICHEFDGAGVTDDELVDMAFDALGLDGDEIANVLAARWRTHKHLEGTALFTGGFVEGLLAGVLLARRNA